MKFKFATQIVKEINERGPVELSTDSVSGEPFEEWLRSENNINTSRMSIPYFVLINVVDNAYDDNSFDYGEAA